MSECQVETPFFDGLEQLKCFNLNHDLSCSFAKQNSAFLLRNNNA
jgi:hypothetical protein